MFIPVRVDVPMDRRPWVNYTIIIVTVATTVLAWFDAEVFDRLAGFGTSCLLHIGLVHLIGNMLFLWVFGNAVNYKFGQVGYLGLYIACALMGDLAHYVFSSGTVVGASGAINGVMGAFLVFFPRNDISIFWMIWYRPGISQLSSMWMILFWIAWDLFFLIHNAPTQVAHWAHVGGFLTGFIIALVCAFTGLIKPTQDEQTLLDVLGISRRGTS